MARTLNDESIKAWLKGRSGWKEQDKALVKEFRFRSFRDAIVFVNRIASLADDAKHHPDMEIHRNTVRLSITTHRAGGITEKDLDLAEKVDFATSAR